MRDVWTPRLIPRAAPDAKILVIFRDPVERYRSGVLHTLARRGGRAATYLATDAVERGRYALQLKRVFDYVDRSQVLILQFERGLAEPLEQYHRTLEFIGLPPEHVPTDLTRTRGTPQSAKKEPFWDDFKQALVRELEPDVAELKELAPEIDLELWPNFRHLAVGAKRESGPEPVSVRIGQLKSPEGRPPDFVGVGTGFQLPLVARAAAPASVDCAAGNEKGHSLEFFSTFCKRAMTEEDIHAYHARFERPGDSRVGEWSADYMYDIWTPMLLGRAAPDAKLLVMLVDPVERFRLMIANSWQRRSAKERTNNRAAKATLSNSVPRGRYLSRLRDLYEVYPPDRVLVLQYERCVKDPADEYARTLRFLGVDDACRPDKFRGRPLELTRPMLGGARRRLKEKLLPKSPPKLWPDLEIPMLAELESDVRELSKLVPDLDLSLWPSFTYLATAPELCTHS